MHAEVVALVPFRAPGEGKSRLGPELGPADRAALSGAMLADTTAALSAAGLHVVVVARGGGATLAGGALGLEVIEPGGSDLNHDLDLATAVHVSDRAILIVVADLPSLRPADIRELLARPADVVVAATLDGGTGGLLRRPPVGVGVAYGAASAAAHARLAAAAGRTCDVVEIAGFAHDVDTLADLERIPPTALGPATAAVLARIR